MGTKIRQRKETHYRIELWSLLQVHLKDTFVGRWYHVRSEDELPLYLYRTIHMMLPKSNVKCSPPPCPSVM